MDLEFGSLEMLALGTFWLCGVTTGVLLAIWADHRPRRADKNMKE